LNPPNDWEIKKCLVLCLGLLLVTLGLIGLDVPGLRQVAGFLLLTFVPGILLLRILKIHNIGLIESLLYAAGLSLAFVMTIGVVANFALPPLGISQPIILPVLLIAFTAFFLILCFLAYVRDKNFHPPKPLPENKEKITILGFRTNLTPFLLAALLPLLAILGAILVNSYQNNALLLALIFVIAILIGVVAFNKSIPSRVYPFMIAMMAIALLYQTTLISSGLVGSDIHLEYYWGKLVLENGYWNAAIPSSINSCLSIVILAPVYSLLLNMDIAWLFKIIYPLSFCLLPLALFQVFRSQIGSRYAFFTAFFFIAMPMFFMDMAQLARQQVSELFFILVVLLMVDRKLTLTQRSVLAFIFSFGVVVSHYGLGIGYVIGYLAFGALALIIIKSRPGRTIWQWLVGRSQSLPSDLTSAGAFNRKALAVIVGVTLIFAFAYYGVVASGVSSQGFVVVSSIAEQTGEQVIQGITTPPTGTPPTGTPPTLELPGPIQNITARFPFLDPLAKEPLVQTALGFDFAFASTGGKVWRIFQYLVELCLIVGFIRLIFRPRALGFKFRAEYLALTIVSLLILVGLFALPTTGWGLGTPRVFGITLLLTAPLFLLGGELIGQGIVKFARVFRRSSASSRLSFDSPAPLRFLVLAILLPYFIFNSGVVFELSRSQTTNFINIPYSIALSSYRVDVSTVFTRQDVTAAEWFSRVAEEDCLVYADHHSNKLFLEQIDFPCEVQEFSRHSGEVRSPSYFYLRAWNVQKRVLTFGTAYAARQSIPFKDLPLFMQTMEKADVIYDNGGAQVLALNEAPP
jgi:uncharacterized membrane protein